MKLAAKIFLGLLILSATVSSIAATQLTKEQGDRLERKIEEITKNASADPVRSKRTTMPELEVNSYLNFNLRDKIPRGLTNPPLNYISGQVPVTARGMLRAQDGKGRFQLGSAEILGVPLPKPLLQELVTFFSRTPDNPNGFNIDAPFNLPAKIREVVVNRSDAVVVQ